MIELDVDIPSRFGPVDTFICHPERGGPHPTVILYMDAPGFREELFDMVRRIATVGYYVLLPNLYHRHGRRAVPGPNATDESHPDHARMWEYLRSLSLDGVGEVTHALLDFAEHQEASESNKLAAIGYCMSGPFAVTAAARFPDRFAAAASLYGVGLVTDAQDSPHRAVGSIEGELYFGFAELDPHAPVSQIPALREALDAGGNRYEIEVYPGCDHGFGFPERYCYDKQAAERLWERLFALLLRTLPPTAAR
jgi:carboxymethylenebutenolidase